MSVVSVPTPSHAETLVIGAGLAGLTAARSLRRSGREVHLIEASDGVGGRVRTDQVDGFRLDRGFQVLLTAYPELRRQVDIEKLNPRPFDPGSRIRVAGAFHTLTDPWRNPVKSLRGITAPVGTLADKLRVARLRSAALSAEYLRHPTPDRSIVAELEARGFSDGFIDTFFRPFLGGVLLERELRSSARYFHFLFACFARGDAVVPAEGMGALPLTIAEELEGHITLDARVEQVDREGVTLDDGTRVTADQVVLAVDGAAAERLTGLEAPPFRTALTAWFDAPTSPVGEPILVLNGEGVGVVNHLAVMSDVAPTLAPDGRHLIAVNGVGPAADDPDGFPAAALTQLQDWFGPAVREWRHLRTHHIPHALPGHEPGSLHPHDGPMEMDGVLVCGDHRRTGSIQGALESGRQAAERVLGGR